MERLHFGARAQRRAQRARLKRIAVVAWIVALVGGVPGATAALDLIGRLDGAKGSSARSEGLVIARVETGKVPAAGVEAKELKGKLHSDDVQASTGAVAVATPTPGSSISEIVYAAAAEFGLDGGYLLSVAECESGLDPGAVNPAGYYGLFQFDETTWGAYGYGSIYDPIAQSRTAARLLAAGQSSRWPNCA